MAQLQEVVVTIKPKLETDPVKLKALNEALIKWCKKPVASRIMTQKVLDKGADSNTRDQDGNTALSVLIYLYNLNPDRINILARAKKLLEYGANPNLPSQKEDNTSLVLAVREGLPVDFIQTLLSYGANPDIRDDEHNNLLIYAIDNKEVDIEVVKVLLNDSIKHPLDVDSLNGKNGNQYTALKRAIEKKRLDMAALLLNHGAKQYLEALKYAITNFYYDGAKLILSHKGILNQKDIKDLLTIFDDIWDNKNCNNGKSCNYEPSETGRKFCTNKNCRNSKLGVVLKKEQMKEYLEESLI